MKNTGPVPSASTRISQPSQSREDFLYTLFNALDTAQVRYCVLHAWEELPEKLASDLDIAVHPKDRGKLPLVFQCLRDRGYTPVQVFNYFVNAYYFIFSWFEGLVAGSVAIDIIFEHRRGGLIVPSGEALVSGRRRERMFWIPTPESEFIYLLSKKTWKRTAPARQAGRLRTLVKELGRPVAEQLAGALFLGKLRVQVVEACADGCLNGLITQIRNQTWKTSLLRNPLSTAGYLVSDAFRRVNRWMQPTGLLVVIMGPDGAGKSTLIEHLVQAVGPAFRRHKVFHWRPSLLWRREGVRDTTQPHSQPSHGGLWSVARLFAYVLDYWLGYQLLIRPLLARSGLVMFDRYFDDMLIDPKRYRYGGPMWLAQALHSVIPKPDLVLVLDANEEVFLSRKQEVPPDEVRRQRHLYRTFTGGYTSTRVMDASRPISQVTAESAGVILKYLSERLERRQLWWSGSKP
jgi:thymidylate kinase